MTKKELIKKRRAVLNDTIAHFNLKNRCVNRYGDCRYIVVEKDKVRGCAIGRLIKDKELCKRLDKRGPVSEVFRFLPQFLKDLGERFLTVVQRLHDDEQNWREDGLSERGRDKAKAIRQKYLH